MSKVNQEVSVNAFYFAGKSKMFPRCIEWDGTQYTFRDGLQYMVKSGERALRLFDMSDGELTYRLRLEDNRWTLVSTR